MSRLTDKQISNLIEDIRKIHSPTPASGEGSFAAPTGLGHNTEKHQMKKAPIGFINKQEAADVLGCALRSVDNYMKKKLIPYYKFGKHVFFKESDLLQAVESRKVS